MLILSIVALLAGPLLFRVSRNRPLILAALDGFLLVAIGGLVTIDVIPDSVQTAGWWALVFALLGFVGPSLVEHGFRSAAKSAHRIAIVFGLISLTLHALTDGAALAASSGSLPLAVVLHRIAVGMTIWWLLRPGLGASGTIGILVLVAVATIVGFGFGGFMERSLSGSAVAFFAALVAGSLLHVVFHRTEFQVRSVDVRDHPSLKRLVSGTGALLAAILVMSEMGSHLDLPASSDGLGFQGTFWSLSLESAPALLLAYVLSGFVAGFLPRGSILWMNRGRRLWQSMKGMIIGLPLPVCSCGVLPLFRTLSRQGASASAGLAFLIATPELGLDAVILSFPLLGSEMTAARLIAAALVALAVGWILGTFWDRTSPSPVKAVAAEAPEPPPSMRARLTRALHSSLEVIDHTAPWILLGLCVAAVLEPQFQAGWLDRIPGWLEVPFFALLGLPMYVCASGATPMVAVLLVKGVSPGAALAFLLTGPATNVTTFGIVSEVLSRRAALLFGVATAALSIASGYLLNQFLLEAHPISLEEVAAEPANPLAVLSVVAVSALFILSLLRQGPRHFLGQIFFQ